MASVMGDVEHNLAVLQEILRIENSTILNMAKHSRKNLIITVWHIVPYADK